MSQVIQIISFVLGTSVILWVSWPSLRIPWSRGFIRTFVFEFILLMFLLAVDQWFVEPFRFTQIVSWVFLVLSLALIFSGVWQFRRKGKIDSGRSDPALVGIEKTTVLVTTGIYRYIRHPFYSSLLFLSWGIFLKDVEVIQAILTVVVTALLVEMASMEEKENLAYFGEKYRAYMHTTKKFIPYLF